MATANGTGPMAGRTRSPPVGGRCLWCAYGGMAALNSASPLARGTESPAQLVVIAYGAPAGEGGAWRGPVG